MKRTLLAIVLGILTFVTMAQEKNTDRQEIFRVPFKSLSERDHPPSEVELKGMLYARGTWERQRISTSIRLWTAKDIADEYVIPYERMTEIVEDMIRKRLANPENKRRPENEHPGQESRGDEDPSVLYYLVMDLRLLHGTNTLALLKECTLYPDSGVQGNAIVTYIRILEGGGDSVPFLRESIAKGLLPEGISFYYFFPDFIAKLKEKGQTEDVEKLHGFMLERLETEPEHHNVEQLDRVLCATLEGYEKSPRRQVAVERIATLKQEAKERTERREQEMKEKEEGKSSP